MKKHPVQALINAAKTHCKHGHSLDDHIVEIKNGRRYRRCRICQSAHMSKWFERNKEEVRASRTAYMRKWRTRKAGVDPKIYDELLKRQQSRCAICGELERAKREGQREWTLALDHDHLSGKIRGLLCSRCNVGLGYFRDSIEILRSALNYLDRTA